LILYQAGCVYALISAQHADDKQLAREFLAKALQADPALAAVAVQDPDLAALRDDPALRALLSAANTLYSPLPTPDIPGN
jgi:ABC-type Fe2+-enterobactin transport system substrate-binding protein